MIERTLIQNLKINMKPEDALSFLGRRGAKLNMEEILGVVNKVANPKIIIKEVVCKVDGDCVSMGDAVFKSSELAEKLAGRDAVILFVSTAGNEISESNIENQSVKDVLTTAMFANSQTSLFQFMEEHFGGKNWCFVKPGVVADWPVIANIDICRMIGEIEEIGVTLNGAGYMSPINSNAGLLICE